MFSNVKNFRLVQGAKRTFSLDKQFEIDTLIKLDSRGIPKDSRTVASLEYIFYLYIWLLIIIDTSVWLFSYRSSKLFHGRVVPLIFLWGRYLRIEMGKKEASLVNVPNNLLRSNYQSVFGNFFNDFGMPFSFNDLGHFFINYGSGNHWREKRQ